MENIPLSSQIETLGHCFQGGKHPHEPPFGSLLLIESRKDWEVGHWNLGQCTGIAETQPSNFNNHVPWTIPEANWEVESALLREGQSNKEECSPAKFHAAWQVCRIAVWCGSTRCTHPVWQSKEVSFGWTWKLFGNVWQKMSLVWMHPSTITASGWMKWKLTSIDGTLPNWSQLHDGITNWGAGRVSVETVSKFNHGLSIDGTFRHQPCCQRA